MTHAKPSLHGIVEWVLEAPRSFGLVGGVDTIVY
jgi:hypothetical protein